MHPFLDCIPYPISSQTISAALKDHTSVFKILIPILNLYHINLENSTLLKEALE